MHREDAFMFKDVRPADIPQRTDVVSLPNYRNHKPTLFGKHEGIYAGCRYNFPLRNFAVDHGIPQAMDGTDHPDNLQLLCNTCNSMKGTTTQEALIAKSRIEGIRVA